jgi:hypothetical protein
MTIATNMATVPKLKAVAYQGLIHEDVMEKISMIDPIDLPYQDMAGAGERCQNFYKSWVQEGLASPDLTNARIDGEDAGAAGTYTEQRIGNHVQLSDKIVKVSTGAQLVDTIGYSNRLVHELMIRQKELKRDMEAILVSNQASVEATDSVAGKTAGCGAMFTTAANIINGTTGGFSAGIFSAPTPGAGRALTETDIRDASQAAYLAGGNPTKLMSTPAMIRKISEYLFTASARIATLTSDVGGSTRQGKYGKQGVTAVGAVNIFVSDFDTLELIPNRMQQTYTVTATACVNVYLFDPDYWDVSYLQGIRTEPMAKTGTSDVRQMTVYYMNIARQSKSSAIVMGINPALAVTA